MFLTVVYINRLRWFKEWKIMDGVDISLTHPTRPFRLKLSIPVGWVRASVTHRQLVAKAVLTFH